MKTEQELKNRVTPEIIKKMVEFAEGFGFEIIDEERKIYKIIFYGEIREIYFENDKQISTLLFSLLIHRAVEGWNKADINRSLVINQFAIWRTIRNKDIKKWLYDEYKTQTLTACECAMLDCLINIFDGREYEIK